MFFNYLNNQLLWKKSNLCKLTENIEKELLKDYKYIGPYFIYNQNILIDRLTKMNQLLKNNHLFYSVKSCSNIHILKIIKQFGNFGLDVVSAGEIYRGLLAGFSGDNMVFAGVGKTNAEIQYALENNIKSFHVESLEELENISNIAKSLKKNASIALRINPDISVETHEFITTAKEENKFGISEYDIEKALRSIHTSDRLKLIGLQLHLGSQILDVDSYIDGLSFLKEKALFTEKYLNIELEYLSLGGGFGIDYDTTTQIEVDEFSIEKLAHLLAKEELKWRIDFEPGRFISAYMGILLSHVQYVKKKKDFEILITDSGMTEVIRPALYGGRHPVLPLRHHSNALSTYDVVGPICESTDFFAKKIQLTEVKVKDKLALLHVGAYGSTMSSNYNSRVLVPEILIADDDSSFQIIRTPQSKEQMLANEIN